MQVNNIFDEPTGESQIMISCDLPNDSRSVQEG